MPVPAYLPRSLVETARTTLTTTKGSERKYLAREWELRGLLRCSCGGRIGHPDNETEGPQDHLPLLHVQPA